MRARTIAPLYFSIACTTALITCPSVTYGACVIVPTAGDDTYTCDSGIAAGFVDTGGNNTLNLSATGNIAGNVTFGSGIDIVTLLDAGSTGMQINGSLNQGDGDNIFQMNNGTITGSVIQGTGRDIVQFSGGTIGAVLQGAGVDSFAMSGGLILGDVDQGDGLDDFVMNAGVITGAFLSGDRAKMTGGSIGRVNMLLDDNLFDMQGGTIINNLVTGFGNDTILVSGTSYIGGNISVSGGTDLVRITGGTVNGQILTSVGNDRFEWIGGGQVNGFIQLGGDNDVALLQNLVEANVATTPILDGGLGVDTLTLDNSQLATPERYTNFETVNLDSNATLRLGGTFTLGDSGTGTGVMNLNGSSSLLVSTGVITSFDPAQRVTLNNRGVIDMITNSTTATDTLRINGNYNGTGGQLKLQSVLGDDSSASDKLVVSAGALQGTTSLFVTNLNGAGAATQQNGILVVEALNGATGAGTAFTQGGAISAGAFDYRLFKGGVTAGTADNYYLRSTIPVVDPGPVIIAPLPTPGPGDPLPEPGDKEIPLYRPEVSLHAALFPATRQLVRGMLGTFHQRMGEQTQQRQLGTLPAGWGRVYGSSSRQRFEGTVNPTLDSSVRGFQVGTDVVASTDADGTTQRAGVFVGHSRLKGDVKGFNGGWQDKEAGKTTLRSDSLGVYWTLIGANQAYLDLVLMGTRFNGNNESYRGGKMDARGHDVTASAEAGVPLQLARNWVVEPQVQLIVSKTKLDRQNDGVSDVTFKSPTNLTTRLGVRVRGDYLVQGMPFEPYARVNVWHNNAGRDTVVFNGVYDIDTEKKSTTMDLSMGASLRIADDLSVYSELGYGRSLDSNAFNGRQLTVGARLDF
ncbi:MULTISPECIES: autotransporter outer membrane beta-barrel domain-containing protein [Pseudomonas]|uniref:autotransporter family protein n=1 Tax=Pseudomonas TaxID=286 RepID=UPI000CFB6499|nr:MULTISPECIES: autotransporter outer membrane beta-barrel domain-containing protein [Pseudomonas]PQZ93354.1 autotransporter outer membrane beta-barrel domain-containing protein [Pseudomonas trivialis]PRB28675.1 autotransporter outer membrane beta-barrel domain-containing protein [Pseudomonas sp. MYb60]